VVKLVVDVVDFDGDEFYAFYLAGVGDNFGKLGVEIFAELGEVVIFYEDTVIEAYSCLLYTSPSPRDATLSRMPSSA